MSTFRPRSSSRVKTPPSLTAFAKSFSTSAAVAVDSMMTSRLTLRMPTLISTKCLLLLIRALRTYEAPSDGRGCRRRAYGLLPRSVVGVHHGRTSAQPDRSGQALLLLG